MGMDMDMDMADYLTWSDTNNNKTNKTTATPSRAGFAQQQRP
jgi:hypothetical protein